MSEKRVKTGLAVTPGHLKLCDENLRRARVSSRNDFVEEAIEFYAAHLLSRDIPHLWDPPPKTEDVRRSAVCGGPAVWIGGADIIRPFSPEPPIRGARRPRRAFRRKKAGASPRPTDCSPLSAAHPPPGDPPW